MMDYFLLVNSIILQQFGWNGYTKRKVMYKKKLAGNIQGHIYIYVKH